MSTDDSYNYINVFRRIRYVTAELIIIGVTVPSSGIDGAGLILQAMVNEDEDKQSHLYSIIHVVVYKKLKVKIRNKE